MPSFDKVDYQDRRLASLRSTISMDTKDDILLVRNKVSGFQMPRSSGLKDSYMFPDIKKIVQSWNFDTRGTVFEDAWTK